MRPLALARLATAFADPLVAAATGSVLVTRHPNLLTRFQQIEYVRNTLIRVAWAELAALEQLPGAFMAVRADWVRAVGGYPTASLTEDYELIYRFYARAAATSRPLQIAAVPTACAYTEVPIALPALLRQRTRWFAGFLSTLVLFRRLIGRPKGAGLRAGEASHQGSRRLPPCALSLLSLFVIGFDTGFVDLRAAGGELVRPALGLGPVHLGDGRSLRAPGGCRDRPRPRRKSVAVGLRARRRRVVLLVASGSGLAGVRMGLASAARLASARERAEARCRSSCPRNSTRRPVRIQAIGLGQRPGCSDEVPGLDGFL